MHTRSNKISKEQKKINIKMCKQPASSLCGSKDNIKYNTKKLFFKRRSAD
jgi:hypothetical protein